MQTRSEVIEALAATIRTHGIDPVAAATEIGVTAQSLVRHLAGGYVRSDSLAKYRRWLTGISTVADEHPPRQRDLINVENTASTPGARRADRSKVNGKVPARRAVDPQPTADAFRVVETFSGCGGLSLGFDLFNGANTFRTVLAMDIEKAMVNSYNWSRGTTVDDIAADVCRQTDLSDFLNEAEIVAFYLDHIATHENDRELRSHLDLTPGMSLAGFKEQIADIDAAFIVRLRDIYSSSEFKQEQRRMPEASRLQTSVSGFFDALRLPTAPGRQEMLAPLVWSSALSVPSGDGRGRQDDSISAQESLLTEADKLWEDTVQTLTEKAGKRGARGQLASSANRIAGFVEFLGTAPMREVKVLWTEWYARRKNLRTSYFTDGARRSHLLAAYEAGKEVAVVLGGPPCQGFSRIGRGKIRSLLETGVQVHLDPESGDARNRLLEKYVLFVAALKPKVFVFENVRHFSSSVKTSEGSFLATEVLASAISELSRDDLHYQVSSRILAAHHYGIPQKRERFFMVGLRDDVAHDAHDHEVSADSILDLEHAREISLSEALEGLPDPLSCVAGPTSPMAQDCLVGDEGQTGTEFRAWITAPAPRGWKTKSRPGHCDAHCVRPARRDDAAFFRLMGPGTRWMDYRCDDSRTLSQLRESMSACIKELSNLESATVSGLLKDLERLQTTLNGSLSLRLLLENIAPLNGELEHHLLGENYLAKRDGQHGDWVARLSADEPSKTMVSHMGKDTYGFVHPWQSRMLSVREAARVQSFPDWFSFGNLGLVDAFRVVGNAVPPLLSHKLARGVAHALWAHARNNTAIDGHAQVETAATVSAGEDLFGGFDVEQPAERRSISRKAVSAA